jgi:Porin PorA
MQRTIGMLLIGVGAFFLTLSPLVRFYAAEQLLALPIDTYETNRLLAQNGTYFDAGNLKLRQGVTVVATNTVRGDVRASNDKVAVWDSFTSTSDATTGTPIDYRQTRLALNRRTSHLTMCCGAAVGNDTTTRQSGLSTVWPVANVEKKTYQYFDVATKQTLPMNYDGEETVHGLRAYRFVQRVPATRIAEVADVPGSVLGLGENSGNVDTDRYFQETKTVWVDPRTGAVVNQQENIRSTLHTKDGVERLTVAAFNLRMIPADQQKLVKLANDNATVVTLVKTIVPLGTLILGAILLVAGILVSMAAAGRGDRGDRGARRAEVV